MKSYGKCARRIVRQWLAVLTGVGIVNIRLLFGLGRLAPMINQFGNDLITGLAVTV